MRILFDHGTPSGIARSLAGHEVTEALERYAMSGAPGERQAEFHLRSTTNFPITKASSLVLRNVRTASLGEQTIGSSASLKEVFNNTGHPVLFPNSERSL